MNKVEIPFPVKTPPRYH